MLFAVFILWVDMPILWFSLCKLRFCSIEILFSYSILRGNMDSRLPQRCFQTFAGAVCRIPDHFQGEYYCIDNGEELTTLITNSSLSNELTDGAYCDSIAVHNESLDAQGRFDATILLFNRLDLLDEII
jgi:hypothetical protein